MQKLATQKRVHNTYGSQKRYIYDTDLLFHKMMEKELNPHQLANIIKAKYGNAAVPERTVYNILNGKSPFPSGRSVSQISNCLGMDIQKVIIENPKVNQ